MLLLLPIPILIALSLLGGMGSSVARGVYAKKYSSRLDSVCFYNGLNGLLCALFIFILSLADFKASLYTVLMALLFSVIVVIQLMAVTKALGIGPVSYTSIISSFSTIITAFSGLVIWGEKVSIFKYFGIVFIVASMILSVKKSGEGEEKKKSVKWFIFAMAAMIFTAGVGLLQKTHQKSSHADEINALLILMFLFVSVFYAIILLILAQKHKKNGDVSLKTLLNPPGVKKSSLVLNVVIGALCGAVINIINLYLSGQLPSAVMFPVVNGGTLLLTIIVSVIFLGERLDLRQKIGMGMGLLAMVFLCF